MSIHTLMLPLLWELCIHTWEDDYGPCNYQEIVVREAHLALHLSDLKRHFFKPNDYGFYTFLLEYVTEDLGLVNDSLVLRGCEGKTQTAPYELARLPHQCSGFLPYDWSSEKESGEKRPCIPSRYPCGTYHQVEKHIETMETNVARKTKFFTLEEFETLTSNFNEIKSITGPTENIEDAAKDIMSNVQFLCNLIKERIIEHPSMVYRRKPKHVGMPHTKVLTAVRMPELYKNQPTSALVCLTRTLAKLEKALFGGVLTSLLRGEID